MGYRQLANSEGVLRDMKQRIRRHILLCWLAMLMIRIAEQGPQMKNISSKLHLGTLETPPGYIPMQLSR